MENTKERITFKELNRIEQDEIAELFSNWLSHYAQHVVIAVMEKAEDIINNEFAMKLLKELYDRKNHEREDFKQSIENLFTHFDAFKEYDPHNHPLEHAGSYRDILYDMFIR